MVGGFISIVSFLLVKYGAFTSLSVKYFEEPTKLAEFMESLHVTLFLVFTVFILQILVLLLSGYFVEKRWKRLEAARDDPHRPADEYYLLREEFVNNEDAPLPANFNFALYLATCLGETVARLVAIPPTIWIVALVMFFVQWFIQGWEPEVQIGLFIANSWVLVILGLICMQKLSWIHSHLIPATLPGTHSINDLEAAPLLSPSAEQLRRPPRVRSLPLLGRSKLGRWILGAIPNRHESLFWFGKPNFLVWCMSAISFQTAVFVAIFVFQFASFVWSTDYNVALKLLFYFLALVPPVSVSCVLIPRAVQTLVICSKVEQLKEVKTIKKTLLHDRTKKTVKALRLLYALRMTQAPAGGSGSEGEKKDEGKHQKHHHEEGRHGSEDKGKQEASHGHRSGGGKKSSASAAHPPRAAKEDADLRELFDLFDADKTGEINVEELGGLLHTLGHELSKDQLQAMMRKIDSDASGYVSFVEFSNYMQSLMAAEAQGPISEHDVEHLFKLFDKEGGGTISVDEFETTFKQLGQVLTPQELHEFVQELDEDGSGTIELEEFAHFLRKYAK